MKKIIYGILQILWGLPQTLFGFAVFLRFRKAPHAWYHGAVVTEWRNRSGLSLGLFLFIPEGKKGQEFLVHEYGHTIQSLVLGPFYLFVIGIPSAVWCNVAWFVKLRRKKNISYQRFYTERWANRWGEKATGETARL